MAGLLALVAVLAWPLRADVYQTVAPSVADAPVAAALAAGLATYGLLVLVALAGILAVRTFHRDRAAFWRLAGGGVGVISAYLLSELLKVMVTEERPCRVWDVPTALVCPGVGDWSWPSNHSVVAAAFAAACIIAVPRTAWLAVPVALLVALARLAAGVHYLHDVGSGLALGTAVVAVGTVLLRPVIARLPVGREQ